MQLLCPGTLQCAELHTCLEKVEFYSVFAGQLCAVILNEVQIDALDKHHFHCALPNAQICLLLDMRIQLVLACIVVPCHA